MKISVRVSLSAFSQKALGGRGDEVAAELERAIRVYLSDRGTGKPGWACPADLTVPEVEELELLLGEGVWRALEEEAAAQEVPVSRLAAHASLYYAAERDSGRLTRRILDRVEAEAE